MKIAISGATGFIGSHLSTALSSQGHQVISLGRELFQEKSFPQLLQSLADCDTVINLAGAPINHRWNSTYKKILSDSRLIPTRQLVKAINTVSHTPQLMISASAVGYYPSTGCYDEQDQTPGNNFLSELCQQWEAEANQVNPQVRLAITRFGLVLSPDGGALKQLLRITRNKIGTIVGSGTQPFSWIDLQDLIRAILFIIDHPSLKGIFNLVAPQQIDNATFTHELAQYTGALVNLRIPASIFQLLYGEGADFLLQGQCVRPQHLEENNFIFQTPTIQDYFKNKV